MAMYEDNHNDEPRWLQPRGLKQERYIMPERSSTGVACNFLWLCFLAAAAWGLILWLTFGK